MGCFWSKDDTEVIPRINSLPTRGNEEIRSFRPTINRNSIPHQYVIRTPIHPTTNYTLSNSQPTRQVNQHIVKPRSSNRVERPAANSRKVESKINAFNQKNIEGPKFGEFKCKNCGRIWNSRLCWPDKYQICKYCRKPVYAHNHRALQPSDISDDTEKLREHPKELCEKCKQLGRYCNTKVYKIKLNL